MCLHCRRNAKQYRHVIKLQINWHFRLRFKLALLYMAARNIFSEITKTILFTRLIYRKSFAWRRDNEKRVKSSEESLFRLLHHCLRKFLPLAQLPVFTFLILFIVYFLSIAKSFEAWEMVLIMAIEIQWLKIVLLVFLFLFFCWIIKPWLVIAAFRWYFKQSTVTIHRFR